MADRLTQPQRSKLMARVRQKNTAPELLTRKLLWGIGYRYRLHTARLPGRPDIVFPGRKKVIFVHGCFWHAHNCRISRVPSSNVDYWKAKLTANRLRDKKNIRDLNASGWDAMVVWQCSLQEPKEALARMIGFLGPPPLAANSSSKPRLRKRAQNQAIKKRTTEKGKNKN